MVTIKIMLDYNPKFEYTIRMMLEYKHSSWTTKLLTTRKVRLRWCWRTWWSALKGLNCKLIKCLEVLWMVFLWILAVVYTLAQVCGAALGSSLVYSYVWTPPPHPLLSLYNFTATYYTCLLTGIWEEGWNGCISENKISIWRKRKHKGQPTLERLFS